MPREIIALNNFGLGLNTSLNERDVNEAEVTEAINVDFSETGIVKSNGAFNNIFIDTTLDGSGNSGADDDNDAANNISVTAGHGIHPWQIDTDLAGNNIDNGGYYLAIFKANTTANNSEILFWNEPQETAGTGVINNNFVLTHDSYASEDIEDSIRPAYYDTGGGLRCYSRGGFWEPQLLSYVPGNRNYFKGASANQDLAGTNTYSVTDAFVTPPTGGDFILINDQDTSAVTLDSADIPSAGNVDIMCDMSYQVGGSTVPVGWGKDESTVEKYNFYASFVYDGNQESTATEIGSDKSLGGGANNSEMNDMTIYPQVLGGATFNKRITSVRLYYRKVDASEDVLFFLGDFPTFIDRDSSENVASDTKTPHSGACALIGDGSGKGDDGTYTLGAGIGNYHEKPPTVYTHAVMSGMRPRTVSTNPLFKTAVVHNQRLYVGNVSHKTPESPSARRSYPDRMLKSLKNRHDCIPDNQYVDVVRRDGENIVRLESLGNRLFQFKERTLYVLVSAGQEEYLEGTYAGMGILHPEAVASSPYGMFWVNEFGAYIFPIGGESSNPQSITDGKIDKDDWANFITEHSICTYLPTHKSFCVIKSCLTSGDSDETGGTDVYMFNLLTKSWTTLEGKFGEDAEEDCISNICNYLDSNGVNHIVHHENQGSILEWKNGKDVLSSNTAATHKLSFITKELTGDTPHLRKKFYKLYITYKTSAEDNSANNPDVKVHLIGPDGQNNTCTLDSTDGGFEDTAVYKTSTWKLSEADASKGKNVYSVKIEISGEAVRQDFFINDMSIVVRRKSAK